MAPPLLTSFVAPDPPGGEFSVLSGTYDLTTGNWLSPRTVSIAPTFGDGASAIALVPEPTSLLPLGGLGLLAWHWVRRRRAQG